jgi:ABC-2 type transport system ATP-binding protein
VNLPVGALEVDHVTKTFRLYQEQYRTLKERALHLGHIPFHEFDAVHDVDFEVRPGQMLGLLGHNGSGKSTLLKCIAGTMQPTAGSIRLNGRLAALLELGAGFHPELTGRENVFLAGSIMGYSKRDISAVFDDIVAFAELEQFIDNQVKHYSSGMFARLGFALAVNVEPEILLIDEILAVGDEAFQQKCLDRFRTFREQGVTMIFVTHDTDLASTICDELVVLDRGRMIAHGDPVEAAATYRRHLYGDSAVAPTEVTAAIGGITFDSLTVRVDGHPTTTVRPGDIVTFEAEVTVMRPIDDLVVAYAIRDPARNLVNSSNTSLLGVDVSSLEGTVKVTFTIDGLLLLNGAYEIDIGAHTTDGSAVYAHVETAARFAVVGPSRDTGVAHLPVRGEVIR